MMEIFPVLGKVGEGLGRNSTTIWKKEANFLLGHGGEEGKLAPMFTPIPRTTWGKTMTP